MKKRVLAFLTASTLALALLAGCNNNGGGGTSTGGTDSNTAGAGETSGDAIVLSFPSIWVGTDSKAEVFGKMVAGFNEEYAGVYQIQVEEQTDYDLYRDKIRTQVSSGSTPDIFTVDTMSDVELFSSSGNLMDLTAFFAGSDMYGRFTSNTIENAQVDGVNYAFPYEMAIVPIMANGSLLESVDAEMPTSFDELWTVSEALQTAGVIPITQMTNDNAWSSMLWYSYAVAAAGGPDVYDRGLDDPAFVQAAEVILKMFDYTSSDAVGADATVVNGHFFNDRAAFYTNGTWILGRIQSEGVEGLYDNLIISPGFAYNGSNGGAYITSVQAYFCAARQDDPEKEAAVQAFFEYITDADRVLELANSSGALFAVEIDPAGIDNPVQAQIAEQAASAPFTIEHFQASMPTTVVNAFPSALESLVLGDVDAEGFVDMLKAAA